MEKLLDKVEIINRHLILDERGYFLKVLNGKEQNLPPFTGEIYITSAYPGYNKGGHYHQLATEWFTLLSGKAKLVLTDIHTQDVIELWLDSNKPQTIVVPPFIAHNFVNIASENFVLIAYTNRLYDPEDTIRFK